MKPLCILLMAVAIAHGQASRATPDAGFDKPLNTTVVDLGASPYYQPSQHVRKKLTCFYYFNFVVKQYDEGEKGAEWLSIVFAPKPPCSLAHRPDEKVIEEWSGYFWGAKENYAIFTAADGDDGGVPFVVFDANSGQKLFEDSSLLEYYIGKLPIKEVFHVSAGAGKTLELAYFRVVRPGCNLSGQPEACWKKTRATLGITQTDIPVCSGYEQADWESTVVYPVSVHLTDSPQIKATDGPVFCWPTN